MAVRRELERRVVKEIKRLGHYSKAETLDITEAFDTFDKAILQYTITALSRISHILMLTSVEPWPGDEDGSGNDPYT